MNDIEMIQLQIVALQKQKEAALAQKALTDKQFAKQHAANEARIVQLQADLAKAQAVKASAPVVE